VVGVVPAGVEVAFVIVGEVATVIGGASGIAEVAGDLARVVIVGNRVLLAAAGMVMVVGIGVTIVVMTVVIAIDGAMSAVSEFPTQPPIRPLKISTLDAELRGLACRNQENIVGV
jgi:hypothetical protein